jgi:HTH-type transcriptional regulator / antitoxin HigA
MNIRPIRSEDDYRLTLAEIDRLMDAEEGTEAFDVLDVLTTLVEVYEAHHYAIGLPEPIPAIELRMAEKGLNQRQLAIQADIAESKMSEVMSYKRPLSISMIRTLSRVLDLPEAVLVQEYPLDAAA